jgi:pSer/pThr/pTyr-binding forkhead associated (FHA) protein
MSDDSMSASDHNWELVPTDTTLDTLAIPDGQKVTVGRQAGCDLVIADPYISRQHVSLAVRNGCLYMNDLDSAQGTFVNDEKISERQLLHGEEVRLERYLFKVKQLDYSDSVVSANDSGATVIRKIPDPGDVDTFLLNEVRSSLVEELDATRPSSTPALHTDEQPVSTVSEDSSIQSESSASPSVEKSDNSASIGQSGKDVVADKDVSAHKGNWWENQHEGPKGTQIFKVGDLPVLDASTQKADIVADGPMLVALTGALEGQEFRLQNGKYILGRGDAADIHIADSTVSDVHAQIIGDGVGWQVVNLISANGTFVNGKNVQTAILAPGDVIRMGAIELQFVDVGSCRQLGSKSGDVTSAGWFFLTLLVVAAIVAGLFTLSYFGLI